MSVKLEHAKDRYSRVSVFTDEGEPWESVVEIGEDGRVEFCLSEGGMVRVDTDSDPPPREAVVAMALQLLAVAGYAVSETDCPDLNGDLKRLKDKLHNAAIDAELRKERDQ